MIEALSQREYQRRRDRLTGILQQIGDLHVEERELSTGPFLRLRADAPGHREQLQAVFDYREAYEGRPGPLRLTTYAYEFRQVPPSGLLAYHWHDDSHHVHCVDPRYPVRDHHFRGHAVTVFEAHEEFYAIYAKGESVSCGHLRPARPSVAPE